jgi:hypothetical protein
MRFLKRLCLPHERENAGSVFERSYDYTHLNMLDMEGEDAVMHFGRLGLPKLVSPGAIGLELGVASGYYSDVLLSVGHFARLYSIDAWADHHDADEYVKCISLLAKHVNRSVVMRMFFHDALVHFPDGFFDFIYVDAYAHLGQQDGSIFSDWYPKLKVGGVLSGHDYDHASWPETVAAVDDFSSRIGRQITVIPAVKTQNFYDSYPSWYLIK